MVSPDDDKIVDLWVMIGDAFPTFNENQEAITSMKDVSNQLIGVKLTPHQGNRVTMPFAIHPAQTVRMLLTQLRDNQEIY